MQQFDVDLPGSFTAPENKESLAKLLNRLFDLQEAGAASLASAIQYENKPKFGPSAISNLHFDIVSYAPGTLNGRLRVTYDMQLTFGCEDLIKDHTGQHSYYNFRFDQTRALLHFKSDAPEEPSTANEF